MQNRGGGKLDLVVVGSIAYDDVETPLGARKDQLGGSTVHFSLSASHFTHPGLVGVVGNDFKQEHLDLLENNGVDTSGVERVEGKTFRWKGHYLDDFNSAVTLDTQLNVFETFSPKFGADHSGCRFLFLANIHPQIQLDSLNAMEKRPDFVACDTMNLWIDTERDTLKKLVGKVDALFINEAEAMSYTGKEAIRDVADVLLGEGVKYALIKRGEYGAALFTPEFTFMLPAYPITGTELTDPTGAGDSFAGGFVGYLSRVSSFGDDDLRRAAVAGSVMASFCVSDFGSNRLVSLTPQDIEGRFHEFGKLTNFSLLKQGEHLPLNGAR